MWTLWSQLLSVFRLLNCNLCWMGGRLFIHAVVLPPNIFYICYLSRHWFLCCHHLLVEMLELQSWQAYIPYSIILEIWIGIFLHVIQFNSSLVVWKMMVESVSDSCCKCEQSKKNKYSNKKINVPRNVKAEKLKIKLHVQSRVTL